MGISETSIDIFISHSHEDKDVATQLIEFLRSALDIEAQRIRCTTVDGYRLPVGTPTNEGLRVELLEAQAFVVLVTPNSLESKYVFFELGARWGARKPLAPILAAGATINNLKEPLSSLNVLSCNEPSQLHQLISDLGQILGRTPGNPSSYQKQLDELVSSSFDPKLRAIDFYLSVEGGALKNLGHRIMAWTSGKGLRCTINLGVMERVCGLEQGNGPALVTRAARKYNYKIIRRNSETFTLIIPWPAR
jgi:hypothetical protein